MKQADSIKWYGLAPSANKLAELEETYNTSHNRMVVEDG